MQLQQAEEYAAAMMRAQQLTAEFPLQVETQEAMCRWCADRGVKGRFSRYLDLASTSDVAAMQWRLTIITGRGEIQLPLHSPLDWHDAVEDIGL